MERTGAGWKMEETGRKEEDEQRRRRRSRTLVGARCLRSRPPLFCAHRREDVLSAMSRVRSCSRSKNAAGSPRTPSPAARDSMSMRSRVTFLFDHRHRSTYAVLAVGFRRANSLLGDLKPLLFGREKDVARAVSPVLYGGCVYIKKDDCCANTPRPTTPASPPFNTLL
ncbi:hypothetical protein C8R45DRAFT_1007066 [Mycena sanguinolenta]|nr:hypothetical protein C8R45DRAFT_1007066 [Mycena sanguinolenta]